MNDFSFFLKWGWDHIISKDALDHLLFMLVLSIQFNLKEWKPLLYMVTAFTVGHSLTLVLSVLDVFRLPSAWVEWLIPCTIGITAILNMRQLERIEIRRRVDYYMILFFGLIHGMGFANAIRFALMEGQSIGWGLLGFNIGLECGQIFVVLSFLLIMELMMRGTSMKKSALVWIVSLFVLLISILMIIDRAIKF